MSRTAKKAETTLPVPSALLAQAPVVAETAKDVAAEARERAVEIAERVEEAAVAAKNSEAAESARSLARRGASAVGRGLTDLARFAGRSGTAVAAAGAAKKITPSGRSEAKAEAEAARKSTRRRRVLVFGGLTLGAVAIGGYLYSRSRTEPPVAAAPPKLAEYPTRADRKVVEDTADDKADSVAETTSDIAPSDEVPGAPKTNGAATGGASGASGTGASGTGAAGNGTSSSSDDKA
ncbi:hypothetical protein DW322_04460 [Rhodococcus rhodnii]|uniref:Uncharacterized protein n=2 Tax=Rhodococcus rhodnii TaxID=38312 RepID=R7WJR0_9NOCA|nr:hypothetical protein [Rhodococcus rhodnii]EOM74234.1 hypothetical protein Rrhod_4377 [Rhodococcus rhodnii LMG 5362]TXG89613.1 hypothetical protein DW322_04460 [Rhodococcus rhodnii]